MHHVNDPTIWRLRQELRKTSCEASSKHRVVLLRRSGSAQNETDLHMLDALHRAGHSVFDLDLALHPSCLVPSDGGSQSIFTPGPVAAVFDRFRPEVVLVGGEGWDLDETGAADFAARGIICTSLSGLAPAIPRRDLLLHGVPATARTQEILAVETPGMDAAAVSERRELQHLVQSHADEVSAPATVTTRLFRHLSAHDLYEHRVEALLETLRRPPHGSGDTTSGPARALALRRNAARPRMIVFSGYYGAGNRGDELLLDALVGHLETALPDLVPVVAGSKPAVVEREHGIQSFARADLDAAEFYAAHASSMVLGPGGHWHDYSIHLAGGAAGIARGARVSPAHLAQLPLLVASYGATVHIHGMGVGPLDDSAARAAVHLTGSLASSITVRDQESAELLEPLCHRWPADVVVSPDVVYGLPLPAPPREPAVGERRRLAVNLRPWSDSPEQRHLLHRTIIDHADRHHLDIVGVPMQATDVPVLAALAAEAAGQVKVDVLPADMPLPALLDVLRGSVGLVAMRLHASLLMHRLRRSAVGLVYDPKVGSHFGQLDRTAWAMGLDADAQTLIDALERLDGEPAMDPRSTEILDGLETAARRQLEEFAALLHAEPVRTPDPGWIHHRAPAQPARRTSTKPVAAETSAPVSTGQPPQEPLPPAAPQPSARKTGRWGLERVARGVRRRLRGLVSAAGQRTRFSRH